MGVARQSIKKCTSVDFTAHDYRKTMVRWWNHDGTMVKQRWHDDETTTARWWNHDGTILHRTLYRKVKVSVNYWWNFKRLWSNVHTHQVEDVQNQSCNLASSRSRSPVVFKGLRHVFRVRYITSKPLEGISWNLHQIIASLRRYAETMSQPCWLNVKDTSRHYRILRWERLGVGESYFTWACISFSPSITCLTFHNATGDIAVIPTALF
jgi:hypothetical protein